MRNLTCIEVREKRGCTVPILLTENMVEYIDLLNHTRSAFQVTKNNLYVFAQAYYTSPFPMSATECLKKYAEKCGAKKPELLTQTRLRKHIGQMTQLVSLSKNELDLLAAYMGHDIWIPHEF